MKKILLIFLILLVPAVSAFSWPLSVADLGKYCRDANGNCYEITSSYDDCSPMFDSFYDCAYAPGEGALYAEVCSFDSDCTNSDHVCISGLCDLPENKQAIEEALKDSWENSNLDSPITNPETGEYYANVDGSAKDYCDFFPSSVACATQKGWNQENFDFTCDDGTSINTCSSKKPLYCNQYGDLVNRPQICECPEGHSYIEKYNYCVDESKVLCFETESGMQWTGSTFDCYKLKVFGFFWSLWYGFLSFFRHTWYFIKNIFASAFVWVTIAVVGLSWPFWLPYVRKVFNKIRRFIPYV